MWRLMCDSDQPEALLPTELAATYSDLIHDRDTLAALQARLPGTRLLFIDRGLGDPLRIATIADTESGALTPDQCRERGRAWNEEKRAYPTAYHDLNDAPAVTDALRGVSMHHWLAWPGHLHAPGHHPDAIQFDWATTLDSHVNLSVVHNPMWNPTGAHAGWASRALSQLNAARGTLTDVAATLAAHQ